MLESRTVGVDLVPKLGHGVAGKTREHVESEFACRLEGLNRRRRREPQRDVALKGPGENRQLDTLAADAGALQKTAGPEVPQLFDCRRAVLFAVFVPLRKKHEVIDVPT